jgi:hypothetical protein
MTPQQATRYPAEPLWVEKIFQKNTGEDFLGIQSVQNNIVGYLLPGIITTTTRARYYSFYSWLISEYGHSHPKGWSLGRFIKRREQVFGIANYIYHWSLGKSDRVGGLLGNNELSKHAADHIKGDTIPYLTGEKGQEYLAAADGGYSIYAGVMSVLGITDWQSENPGKLALLPKGQKLAEAFAESIRGTHYFEHRSEYDIAHQIPTSVLLKYGEKCYLNSLNKSPDSSPILEVLLSLDSPNPLPDPEANTGPKSNMRGTLGVILDIIKQSKKHIGEQEFRQAVMYGLCEDSVSFNPCKQLRPFVAHWRMYQLREYYIYSLYALWEYFLKWLRQSGPASLEDLWKQLNHGVDLNAVPQILSVPFKNLTAPSSISLNEYMDYLLTAQGIAHSDLDKRCIAFAKLSRTPLSEDAVFRVLNRERKDKPAVHVGAAWIILVCFYLRLRGLYNEVEIQQSWHWAAVGGGRRRSPKLFIEQMSNSLVAGHSVLDVWQWLFRDYIIAQHTITALEKWNNRNANTFHFNYVDGLFEWVQDDSPGFSASRFNRAHDMLLDLGLFEINENGAQNLTALGEQTLKHIVDSLND